MLKKEVKSTWDRNRINMIQSYIQKNLQYINTQWEQKEVGLLPCKKKIWNITSLQHYIYKYKYSRDMHIYIYRYKQYIHEHPFPNRGMVYCTFIVNI